MSAMDRRRHIRNVRDQEAMVTVSRKSLCMLELQLRTRLWLDSDNLAEAEKRAIIALIRNGIHTADIETVDAILTALKQERLRVESQRPQMPTRLHEAGECSWEHYHMWELLRDIDVWEYLHSHLQLVDSVVNPDEDDVEEYVTLDPPAPEKPEPVTRRGKQSKYVALTQKNADALYWVAEFTPNGGITSAALGVKLGITQSGASSRIARLMEQGLVSWAPGRKETYVVTDFWYEAEVVVG